MNQVREVVLEISDKRSAKTLLHTVVMSTVSPDDIKQVQEDLNEKDLHYIHLMDAPVSGAPLNAEAGKMVIMVGGDEANFEMIKPALEAIEETIITRVNWAKAVP